MWNTKDDITGWNLDKTRPKKTSCDLCENGKCLMSSLLHCDYRKDGKCLLIDDDYFMDEHEKTLEQLR